MMRLVKPKGKGKEGKAPSAWYFLAVAAVISLLLGVSWLLSSAPVSSTLPAPIPKRDASPLEWQNIPLRIRDKSRTTGKDLQQTFEQYSMTVLTIALNAPTNVLIFGCGLDSYMYFLANSGHNSRTVFLENIPEWLEIVRNDLQQNDQLTDDQKNSVTLAGINYTTKTKPFFKMANDRDAVFLERMKEVRFDRELQSLAYSVVIVDGPRGHVSGRSQAMFVAWNQTHDSLRNGVPLVHVFVHDTNREQESHYSQLFFGDDFVDFNRVYDDEIYNSPDRGKVPPNSMRYYRCDANWAQQNSPEVLHRHFNDL